MKRTAQILSACLMLVSVAAAQEAMPKPGPEHQKLEMFAGSWTLDGDLKSGPITPGGKMTEIEKCEVMDGGFFIVCHSDFKSSAGNGTGLSIMGYSTDDKIYTYREFNSWGEFTDSKGSLDGETWTWTTDEKVGATMMKGRFTIKITSPTSYDFNYDMSPDGTKWTTIMNGKATKSK